MLRLHRRKSRKFYLLTVVLIGAACGNPTEKTFDDLRFAEEVATSFLNAIRYSDEYAMRQAIHNDSPHADITLESAQTLFPPNVNYATSYITSESIQVEGRDPNAGFVLVVSTVITIRNELYDGGISFEVPRIFDWD